MLEQLRFRGVGPMPEMTISFRERMSFLTGDNGLGKTFFLDAAWFVLTRTWAQGALLPQRGSEEPRLEARLSPLGGGPVEPGWVYDRKEAEWRTKAGRPHKPGLVLYAREDGGFGVWDPARNYWKKGDPGRPPSFLLSSAEVWDGYPIDRPQKICNGIIADWATWQLKSGAAFAQLRSVLDKLSPSPAERLQPGDLTRLISDSREHPTLRTAYGQDVPLVHASAGIRRILGLAYLLVWTWQEHLAASELIGQEPTREIVFLIDELEAHLHPQWQRRIVPALLEVMDALTGSSTVPVQLIAATHSPMVMASVEPHFNPERDIIWELDLGQGEVLLQEHSWSRKGDANAWLTSSVFGLEEPTSIEAEEARHDALRLLRQPSASLDDIEKVDRRLRDVLDGLDPFFVRWSAFVEGHTNGSGEAGGTSA